ncbi:basal body-orientation factor 1 isoform X2 [Dromaius novaehollandiae]|uniref:basal body-orientation factor 1 isoform X2 n=1 Tax=Dromaius novaehollandiae TaxID=8790 RepID=UPI00311DD1F9
MGTGRRALLAPRGVPGRAMREAGLVTRGRLPRQRGGVAMAAAGGAGRAAGGPSSPRRNGSSSPPGAARVSRGERAKAGAALWEARLAVTEASRAEYREAARLMAQSNAELLWRQQHLERETMAVMSFLRKQDQEKAEEADQYTQQVKELEEKFQKKIREIGLIQLELSLIKEFRRKKAVMEKELEDLKERMETSNKRHEEVVVRLEKRFFEEKKRLEKDAEKKVIMMTETAHREAVLQLNSTGREVFKENVHLHDAFTCHLKEATELQKIKQKLEEDKTLLLQEKETNEGLIREKILQINQQKAQIGDLQHKVEKLEMALCHMTREFETETQRTQHQALIQNEAGMMEVKKLQQLLEMKDREMNRVKKLARNILDERTEVERFFLDALEHVKQEIIASRKHYKEKAQTAYYRKMMDACAGKEEFPKIKTFKSNINSTNSVYKDLEEAEKCNWEKIQFEKVDISELTWEQKERVLRLLFAKMNGTNLWKYSKDLATSAPAPTDTREENRVGTENIPPSLTFITQQAELSESSSSALILPHIRMFTPKTKAAVHFE